jgi:outer membrane receptor protein involved in Fe transport
LNAGAGPWNDPGNPPVGRRRRGRPRAVRRRARKRATAPSHPADLGDLGLEELGQIPVTSVTGRPQPVQDAAASIFDITAEDIRRSAATSLPGALRLAPDLQVARIDANQYAITARGFPTTIDNLAWGGVSGAEAWGNADLARDWRVSVG